ncbi:DUF1934 domain-containing protein [Amedibacillus sp. YH-ame6]
MISGENVKKQAIVKQKNLNTQDKSIMYKGTINYVHTNSCTSLSYLEYDDSAEVNVEASENMLIIRRKSDVSSELCFVCNELTQGTLMTEFGIIEIEINTHKYIRKDKTIAIEYDILQNGMILESYRIIWDIKEETK